MSLEGKLYHDLLLAKKDRKNIADDLNVLASSVLGSYTKYWMQGKTLLINTEFGFRFMDETVEVLDKLVKLDNIYPEMSEKDIRILRWGEGKHFYDKIGNEDVVDKNGEQKWDTEKEALYWAKKYLKQGAKI